ncbi:SRPBCC family protein [Actinomadura sp. WAC 06369]|uniref:SRPBCC family protein n=1 Tax=Actinomadura sp. WAC 06369 TaxID=2203193 RepID=UPI0018F469A7|nr:SRPBCC family protein [Actinomadura sp. WAC 06369]
MELDHEFSVPVPVDQAWSVLLDVERIAPCMPGATLDAVDGDEYRGRMKVRVGAMTITYRGTVKIVAADEASREVALEASAKEARGSGTAAATVRATLRESDGTTHVAVRTELNVTGRPAQFGRNILAEVGTKIINRFAKNLATEIESPTAPAEPDAPADLQAAANAKADADAKATADTETAAEASTDTEAPADLQAAANAKADAGTTSEASADTDTGEGTATEANADTEAPVDPQAAANAKADADAGTATEASADTEAPADPQAAANAKADADAEAPAVAGAEVARPVTGVPAGADDAARRPVRPAPNRFDDDAIDLLEVAGPSLAKRAVPAVGALVAVLLLLRFLTRRRRG